ncbi:zinc finger protein 2-like [Aphis craccivora]|uniref:Zinc finger protein 2-like n=1 Tax=Aphis craccivora TaxID=307492 RepID=A0A6G0YIV3_APHCR|nr:zinc finger protein 2-like [Aphis craccivora]
MMKKSSGLSRIHFMGIHGRLEQSLHTPPSIFLIVAHICINNCLMPVIFKSFPMPYEHDLLSEYRRQSNLSISYKFTCPNCCRRYSHKPRLVHHLKHECGYKRFICNICYRTFGRKDHLKNHTKECTYLTLISYLCAFFSLAHIYVLNCLLLNFKCEFWIYRFHLTPINSEKKITGACCKYARMK